MKSIPTDSKNDMVYREPVYWSWIISVPFYITGTFLVVYFGRLFIGDLGRNLLTSGWGLLIAGAVALYLVYLAATTAADWFGRRGCIMTGKAVRPRPSGVFSCCR
jgi:hypothetical protein